jgi:hypothetical protein
MLTLLNEGIVHLVYNKGNPFIMDRGLCATWHKITQNQPIPKLEVKIKISGLIQKCSSNHTIKRMVTKIYHAKLIYNGLIQNGAYVH